jgi:hypothetical protein
MHVGYYPDAVAGTSMSIIFTYHIPPNSLAWYIQMRDGRTQAISQKELEQLIKAPTQ